MAEVCHDGACGHLRNVKEKVDKGGKMAIPDRVLTPTVFKEELLIRLFQTQGFHSWIRVGE
ncbi:hypothetical protein [Thiolapillus sp.]